MTPTSTDPHKDREAKRRGCAAAGVPCCLLIDRSDGLVTLVTRPEGEDYPTRTQVEFGTSIDLPAPFSFALDTAPLR
ncbi:Uma2 family endonuclease [Streptomyces sp. NRRL S-350]|uniref:Uma2 family endonuclease n=1 Tax=Streptomyces sp. NRRL S-350 TaxID=1463902 RepID=UPI00068EF156|nr:Uma2 family endonuclease [Streptomyces sp. NRRL S-350]